MSNYKFNLYNIFRFHRNTNIIKQKNYEDRLKYLDKSDNSINTISNKLDNVARKAYNDENKVYSKRSPYNMLLGAFKEITNFFLLYLARSINNLNIHTADNINSVKGLASQTGFEATLNRASTGTISLTVKAYDDDTSTLIINNGAQLINKTNGRQYFVSMRQDYEQFHIRYNSALTLTAIQGIKQELKFTGNGQKLQTINLSSNSIDDSFLEVYVDGVRCERVTKLMDMHFNDYAFTTRNSLTGGINVVFGNGANGIVPLVGSEIKILYVVSDGKEGDTGTNIQFEFVNGVLDRFGNPVDVKNVLMVSSITDFIGGYDGDGIAEIALNAGLQTPSNAIVLVDNYYSFMRKYTDINVVDVWSEPNLESTTNMLVMPNIRGFCDRQLKTYFDLKYSDFELDTDEIEQLHSNIVGDRKYRLMSALNIYQYKLIPFGILVFSKTSEYTVSQQLYNKVVTVIHNTLLDELDNDSQLIRSSKIMNNLQDNIAEMSELFVKFVGDKNYINEFGDISTKNSIINEGSEDFMVIPYITNGTYDGVDFVDVPIKVMTRSGSQWIELNYTQN